MTTRFFGVPTPEQQVDTTDKAKNIRLQPGGDDVPKVAPSVFHVKDEVTKPQKTLIQSKFARPYAAAS